MNNREYQDIPGISSHRLIAMHTSPAHCWRQYLDPDRKPEASTDALRFGTLVHCLALNPHTLDDEFLVADYERRSNAGKARYAQLNQYGLMVIKPAELERAKAIVAFLKANKESARLLLYGKKERTIIEPRAAGLLPLKARLDVHNETKRQVVELKTTRDIATIHRAIHDYHYLLSAAFYQHISQSRHVVFVFVETTAPYKVEIFEPTYWQLDQGREQFQTTLQQFDDCWKANHWPDGLSLSKAEAEPAAPAMDGDPLMMNFLPTNAKPNRQHFELPVGELAL
ncbi:MAG: PD-(D/E)XK nuclease-like domain-containing protein [Candidatus Competibacteraceae bacterium]|nr:PD-(D/E)XK nuclease-like domain-containing protein [Candidatus Competibacteraceae bacterium]